MQTAEGDDQPDQLGGAHRRSSPSISAHRGREGGDRRSIETESMASDIAARP